MKDRNLIGAGIVAVVAGICCATSLVVGAIGAIGAAGLTAWLAKAGNVLIPALVLGIGLIGYGL